MNELDLFIAANAIADAVERAAYLDRVCADQPELRQRLEALLAGNARSRHPLDHPPAHPPAADDATRTFGDPAATGSFRPAPIAGEAEGTVVAGRYKLRQQIGEGGMGTVWMADQTEPVKRKVAVKLIRGERGQSRTILARFEAERQAIALMDHPHIAKLLDAGTTDTGSPFFVMELVKGVPLSDFCDRHRLTIADRLGLFQQICSAVQHAHQKGVIHRDLKPGNVLVESHDGKPVPKVIDFGLAKATTGLQLTDQSMFTAFGSVMGTPLYMAPEQASFNAVDVDTRADVYALGVILYELLTGTTPLTKETMKRAALDEMLKLIREQEAPTPSSRLSAAAGTPGVAANRQIEPAKLGRFVRGELDWIVLKALSKDRDRRYETANDFAKDVERFLNHEPVQAGPPSTSYRLKKFVRRNRGQVIAASLVLLALVAGVVGTTAGLVEARRSAERERLAKLDAEDKKAEAEKAAAAEKAAKEAETLAKLEAERKRQEAETNLAFATKGNSILGSVFAGVNPKQFPTVGELTQAFKDNLKKAVRELDGSAIGDPLVVAQMQSTLGHSLVALGDFEQAIIVLEKARDTRKARLGPDHPATLTSMDYLASAYSEGKKFDRAIPLFEATLTLRKAKLGHDHPETLVSLNNLAVSYRDAGNFDKALPLFEESLRLCLAKYGPNHTDVLPTKHNLAMCYAEIKQFDQAVPLLEETLRVTRGRYGADHPHTLTCMNSLANAHRLQGKLDLALPLFEDVHRLYKARLGATHPDTVMSMNNLAMTYTSLKQFDSALPMLEETLKAVKAKYGPENPEALLVASNLAIGYHKAGQLEKAQRLCEELLPLFRTKIGSDRKETVNLTDLLVAIYLETKQFAKVQPLAQERYQRLRSSVGPDHADTLQKMNQLGIAYWLTGRYDKSVPLFEELVQLLEKKYGRDQLNTLEAVANLGVNYAESGQHAKAIPLLEEALRSMGKHPTLRGQCLAMYSAFVALGKLEEAAKLIDDVVAKARQDLPKGSPLLGGTLATTGLTLLNIKEYARAEPLLREALSIRERSEPDTWKTFNTHSMLGGVLLGQKKYADAEPLLVKGYEGLKAREKTIPPIAGARIPEALDRLIELYTATEKPEEVKKYRELRAQYPTPKEVAPMPNEKK